MILQADKGNATVILDAENYEQKAVAILEQPPFQKVKRNPAMKNERKVNDKLKKMSENGCISDEIHKRLRAPPNARRTPLFNGNVKIQKPDLPLRPIVSLTGSATQRIAKFLNETLSPYVLKSPSYIENTTDFLAAIKGTTLEEDEVMVGFDVKSLFTSVPTKDAANATEVLFR